MKKTLAKRKNIRLNPEVYKSNIVQINMCTRNKKPLINGREVMNTVKDRIIALLHSREGVVYAYVIMPNHIHLLIFLGQWGSPGEYVRALKGNISAVLRNERGIHNVWQKGYYDHVMRSEEDVKVVAEYIVNNPLRKELVDDRRDYVWYGSDIFEFD